jgi:8-oxo-dGTP pyrophosphatase MutT (NUDIX family)
MEGLLMADETEFLRQAGAIPLRGNQICLITSSNGKRWIIPKGLIEEGQTAAETALTEAWEEAGLAGTLVKEPIGSYLYTKLGNTYHVLVFVLQVTDAAEDWPENGLRFRAWHSLEDTLEHLDDAGLRDLVEVAVATA